MFLNFWNSGDSALVSSVSTASWLKYLILYSVWYHSKSSSDNYDPKRGTIFASDSKEREFRILQDVQNVRVTK